ncbi:MAG: aminopeptidase P family protein [Ignavibacteriales bacterium]|nr:aminopeptidase P family protein [Ignavibacteriales bacterium]
MTARRLEEVRRRLSELRLHAIVVTTLPHVQYLTGFSGSHGVCVVTAQEQFFFSDGRYKEQAPQEIRDFRIVISAGSLFQAMQKKRVLSAKERVGFEAQHLTVSDLRHLQKLFPKAKFVPTTTLMEEIAAVKDDGEIAAIKEAVSISDKVFEKLLENVRDGIRESEVAAQISYLHRTLGADADAFEPIVASGTRGALPHARASHKAIRKGEMVTLDFGCRVRGYNSDLTRTICVGKPSDEMRTIYDVVKQAQEAAIASACSGMKAKTLDGIARKHIVSKGYGKYFTHSLGHGLGHEVHELPRISRLSKDVLKEKNVVTVEPGIYVPGVGGVRIEDDVVIRNGSCEVLNHSPKDLLMV